MSEKARLRLKANLKKVGLIEPPVWNRRTGNIVGGHQRIKILDSLEGHSDYCLPVAVVDLDETQEKEQNIALNNLELQGEWDFEKLEGLIREAANLDIPSTGFDAADIANMFGAEPLIDRPRELEDLAERLKAARERHDQQEERSSLKDDYEFYRVLVFESDAEAKRADEILGHKKGQRYWNGRELVERLKGELQEGESAKVGEAEQSHESESEDARETASPERQE